jgi:hypothetical protein
MKSLTIRPISVSTVGKNSKGIIAPHVDSVTTKAQRVGIPKEKIQLRFGVSSNQVA